MVDQQDGDISLVDVFNFYVENWVVLTVLPIVAFAVVFIFVSAQPQSYQASATFSPPAEGADLTSGIYVAALEGSHPANVTLDRGDIGISATAPDRESASRAVQTTLAALLSSTETVLSEERARLDGQRQLLDMVWQNVGNAYEPIIEASRTEGNLAQHADRLARVERWFIGVQRSPVSVSGPTPNALAYATMALLAAFVLAVAFCLARSAVRTRMSP